MRYFIADLHFGHRKVSELRYLNDKIPGGVDIVDHHDAKLIRQLSQLTSGDQLWVLGDISSGRNDGEDYALNIIQNIRDLTGAQFHLIAGNHDSVSSIHKDAWKRQGRYLKTFDSVQQFAKLNFADKDVLLSHFPYIDVGDGAGRGTARYKEFRLIDEGYPLIHGHTHQSRPHEMVEVDPAFGAMSYWANNQYCVSWEVHRGLVKEDLIQEWLWSLDDTNEFYQKDI